MTFEAPDELLDDAAPRRDARRDPGAGRRRASARSSTGASSPRSRSSSKAAALRPRRSRRRTRRAPGAGWTGWSPRSRRAASSSSSRSPARCPKWATKKRKHGIIATERQAVRPLGARGRAPLHGDASTCGRSGTSPTTRTSSARSTEGQAASPSSTASSTSRGAGDPRRAGRRDGQGAVRRDRADRQREPRLAARLPARRALPLRDYKRARAATSCGSTATRTTPTRAAGPTFVSEDQDEVSDRLARPAVEALDKAAKAGAISRSGRST